MGLSGGWNQQQVFESGTGRCQRLRGGSSGQGRNDRTGAYPHRPGRRASHRYDPGGRRRPGGQGPWNCLGDPADGQPALSLRPKHPRGGGRGFGPAPGTQAVSRGDRLGMGGYLPGGISAMRLRGRELTAQNAGPGEVFHTVLRSLRTALRGGGASPFHTGMDLKAGGPGIFASDCGNGGQRADGGLSQALGEPGHGGMPGRAAAFGGGHRC